jgi:ABC-type phosphate/phosphonate transport system ATPase subunit
MAVIIGVGGSGKTTIARQFLQTVKSDISWEINSETDHGAFASFVELAEAIAKTKEQKNDIEVIKSITNNYEKRRRLVNFVASILRDCKSWCLLFDNVEDFSTILDLLRRLSFC